MNIYAYCFDSRDAALAAGAVDPRAPDKLSWILTRYEGRLYVTRPVWSPPDEEGKRTLIQAGVPAKPFTLISPVRVEALAAYELINPPGVAGLAMT